MLSEVYVRMAQGSCDPEVSALATEVLALRARLAEVERELAQTHARLRAYTDALAMKPHKWLALRNADDLIPMPEPESLAAILDDRDRLAAALARYGRHDDACFLVEPGVGWRKCTCGLDAARAPESR